MLNQEDWMYIITEKEKGGVHGTTIGVENFNEISCLEFFQ
jgi:hypothetical protein